MKRKTFKAVVCWFALAAVPALSCYASEQNIAIPEAMKNTTPEVKVIKAGKAPCLSCHDVRSQMQENMPRQAEIKNHWHRVGFAPSERVTIPEKFPLDENGAMQCETCHIRHPFPVKTGALVNFFLRGPNQNSSFCRQCHQEKSGGKEKGNHPVDVAVKKIPEAITAAGGKFGTDAPGQVICETCHIPHGGINSKFLVLPVEDPTMSVLCEACHTKKPGPGQTPGSFSHPIDIKPGAAAHIPGAWKNGEKVVLGINGELVCRTCHKPHHASDKEYLLADHKEGDALCMQCHTGQASVQGTTHDLKLTAPREQNIRKSAAQDTGPCASCHLVHSGTANYLWARKISPEGRAEAYCISCHAAGQCGEKKVPGNYSHPLSAAVPENTAGPLPLYYEGRGEKNTKGTMSCTTCHEVHNPDPVYSTAKVTRGKFLRMGSRGSAAHCMQCHPDQGLVAGTAHDMSVGAPGKAPSSAGVCFSCHGAHNAPQKKYMWAGAMGKAALPGWEEEKGTENNMMVTLCTGCHSPGGTAGKHVPAFGLHPRQFYFKASEHKAELTREAAMLYTVEGNKTSAGTIVCETCHNAHQWNGRKKTKGPGTLDEGTVATSFLRPELHQSFCATCHGREALFKYSYFHNRSSRGKKIKPLPSDEKR